MQRFIYKDPIPLIHGQTYNIKDFLPVVKEKAPLIPKEEYEEKDFISLDKIPQRNIYIISETISDINGIKDCLTLSNYRVFMKRYSHLDDVFKIDCGDSVGVAVRWALVLTHKDINRDINLATLDDIDLKELMNEWEQKQISRIISELYPLINLNHFSLDFKNIITEYKQEQINELINTAILELALEWSYNEDLAEQITGKMLLPFIGDIILIENCKDFSLLKDYEWHCTYTQDLYDSYFDQ